MSNFPKKDEIVNAVLKGIENAKKIIPFGLVMIYIFHTLHLNFSQYM